MTRRGAAARLAAGSATSMAAALALIVIGGQAMATQLRGETFMMARQAPLAASLAGLDGAQAILRASQIDADLGLGEPAGRSVLQAVDPGTGTNVFEVTDVDAAGVPTAISRIDASGGLVSAVRLGFVGQDSPALAAEAAGRAAAVIVGKVGITTAGVAAVTPRAAGGWLVRWVREVGSIPVPGDGVAVQLDPDGSFHGIVRTQHALAPAPVSRIEAAAARQLASARLDAWLPADVRAEATIGSIGQAWLAPNDTFGDTIPPDSGTTLHLAWVVRVTTTGSLAETVAGLEMAFDAGSGAPLGGDLLE